MSDLEFLEPDGSVAAPDADRPARGPGLRVPGTPAALVAAGIGGTLAVLASFRSVYGLTIPTAEGFAENSFSYDGWGRLSATRYNGGVGQHAAPVGIVLCVAAGLTLSGVVLWAIALRHGPRWRRAGSGAVLAAAGAVVAVGAQSLLGALAVRDSYEGVQQGFVDVDVSGNPVRPPPVALHLGGLIWCSLASAVLLIVAVVLRALTADRASAPAADDPAPEGPPTPVVPPHRDDELLGR